MNAFFSTTLDPRWQALPLIELPFEQRRAGPPETFLIVERDGAAVCFVPFHSFDEDVHFREAIEIRSETVYVGRGSRFFAIHIAKRRCEIVPLSGYFGSMHVTDEGVVVASCRRLYRFDHDLTTRWTSAVLGIDGVVVDSIDDGVISGSGEWDPPGGWLPFWLSLETGRPI